MAAGYHSACAALCLYDCRLETRQQTSALSLGIFELSLPRRPWVSDSCEEAHRSGAEIGLALRLSHSSCLYFSVAHYWYGGQIPLYSCLVFKVRGYADTG